VPPSAPPPPPARCAGAHGAAPVLRRLSPCRPRPEASGGPAPPRSAGGARVACGGVQPLGVRKQPWRSWTSPAGGAVLPTASRILCRRVVPLARRVYAPDAAMDARRETGGWLALTRQGLSPGKRRQASLGATTLGWHPAYQPRRFRQPIASKPGSQPGPRRLASRLGPPELSRAS
jgi:hypothetical protein